MPVDQQLPTQLLEFSRSMFSDYITWFNFFVTINFVVAGWFVGKVLTRRGVSRVGVTILAAYFVLQGTLGVYGTLLIRSWYVRIGIAVAPLGVTAQSMAAIALTMDRYRSYLLLFSVSLVSLVVFWIAICWLAYYHEHKLFGQ